MAVWKPYRVGDVVNEIDDKTYVLPVIQRGLVWEEDKMELLFDTLLKGDPFGSIIVIEEERESKPLFSYRPFTRNGIVEYSKEQDYLTKTQYFVIDGQQRLQTFYIGLKGSIKGKVLYFDLFSDYNNNFIFKFEKDYSKLPKILKDNEDRKIKEPLWYSVQDLYNELKETRKHKQVSKGIIKKYGINDELKQEYIEENVSEFYENILNAEVIGISKISVNKSLPEVSNRQRIVELFKRLNDGGTKLTASDLVASILKGFSSDMEVFLKEMIENYEPIGLTQDNLVKLIFLLQDNYNKEMGAIEDSDANFVIQHKNKIKSTLIALEKFLNFSKLYNYYLDGAQSFIPLFFICYHLFHKNIDDVSLENYFNNAETSNKDFSVIKKWMYYSLINGVFRSKGAGWKPYTTGIRKILGVMKDFKGKDFPLEELIKVYNDHSLKFKNNFEINTLDELDKSFIIYLMYDRDKQVRVNDIDHIMPKNLLSQNYEPEEINSIKNSQLLDIKTNRGTKNRKSLIEWANNLRFVVDKKEYISTHLIPSDESLWDESRFREFSDERGKLILNKIKEYID